MTSTLLPSSSPRAGDAVTRRTGAAGLAAALAAVAPRWLDLVEYRADGRWTHLLPTNDAADVLDPSLLSWLPEQGTPLHDHGTSAGAFAVVRGTLTERLVAASRDAVHESTDELTVGRVRHFGPHYVHQVTNTQTEPAISVHVYTPGLAWMTTTRLVDASILRTGTERAGVDW